MTTTAHLTQVPTGNGEPDIFRDAAGRAYWADGSRVTSDECEALEDAETLRWVLARHGLTALDSRAITSASDADEFAAARVDL